MPSPAHTSGNITTDLTVDICKTACGSFLTLQTWACLYIMCEKALKVAPSVVQLCKAGCPLDIWLKHLRAAMCYEPAMCMLSELLCQLQAFACCSSASLLSEEV